ncbi:MAG: hypothetical protein ACREPQ_00905 [Rhodanobacter sp.]
MSTPLRAAPGEAHANETYLARLKQARVDESVLMDAIEAYARERYADEDERDDLVEHLTMPPQVELCRKAVLDVVFSVIAATELPTEEAFRAVVDLMAVEEGDDDVKALKHTFLRTMLDNDELGSQVAERMVYVETRIDAG